MSDIFNQYPVLLSLCISFVFLLSGLQDVKQTQSIAIGQWIFASIGVAGMAIFIFNQGLILQFIGSLIVLCIHSIISYFLIKKELNQNVRKY